MTKSDDRMLDGQTRDEDEMVMVKVPVNMVDEIYEMLAQPPKEPLTAKQREAVFFSLLDDALAGKISGKEAVDFLNGEFGAEIIQWDDEKQALRMSPEVAAVVREVRDQVARESSN
jgi:hypothetical protein